MNKFVVHQLLNHALITHPDQLIFFGEYHFIYVDEIPLTSAGKLNKKILRDQYSQF
ncbi:MAG: hypothetical protein WC389_20325 [Lutibacter sp.]|jgi:acyl-CoA synthetase (AMP-forming)/AMP-acid ligase II